MNHTLGSALRASVPREERQPPSYKHTHIGGARGGGGTDSTRRLAKATKDLGVKSAAQFIFNAVQSCMSK